MQLLLSRFLMTIATLVWAQLTCAGELNQNSTQTFKEFKVHYSVFNSTFIQPNIAEHYSLVRAGDRAIINIAVQDLDGNPLAAKIEGFAENLMQQKKALDFQTVKEPEAIYFLAQLRTTNEEVFDFHITITPDGLPTQELQFTRKLYTEK